jgi:hypothetical protein
MISKQDISFKIVERGPVDNRGYRTQVLIDNNGFICGIFATARQAEKAIPKITRNIVGASQRKARLLKKI